MGPIGRPFEKRFKIKTEQLIIDHLEKEVFERRTLSNIMYHMQIKEPINGKQKTGHPTSWKS